MPDDISIDAPRRPRGRPRGTIRKRPFTTLLMPDVDAWLEQTQRQTGMPLNMIVNAILRGYFIQRGKMRHMLPPTPELDSEAIMVPITPVYELVDSETQDTSRGNG